MALAKRFVGANEDHAKKHDDHHAPHYSNRGLLSQVWRGPRRKRILLGLIGAWVLYVFFKNIPTDLTPVSQRIDPRFPPLGFDTRSGDTSALPEHPPDGAQFYFDGPIKFYNLADTLRKGGNYDPNLNRNVLFAFSSLKSASTLLPLACQMALQQRSHVHVALMGRDDTSFVAIRDVNGIAEEDCPVQWHDARPDYPSVSSERRMKASVKAGLGHLYAYGRASVVIVDRTLENSFFTSGIEEKTNELGSSLIALPSRSIGQLQWLTQLDNRSLRFWNQFQLEIIIHSSSEASASLMRLLRSIQAADYFGTHIPKLTIELPSRVDPPLLQHLSNFQWPPTSSQAANKLTIRRRIDPSRFTPADASLQMVNTFYPSNGATSHVLILTPDAELSPSYYHYLVYAILEYKYSYRKSAWADKLVGVSLDLPTTGLDGTQSFSPTESGVNAPCFLWQAPNSNAALYFGDQWVHFHSFMSNRLTVEPRLDKAADERKLISTHHPAWLEYMLEYMRASDSWMLFPSFASRAELSLVTIHQELYQVPEEFSDDQSSEGVSSKATNEVKTLDAATILTADMDSPSQRQQESPVVGQNSILDLLSQDVPVRSPARSSPGLPDLAAMPFLSFRGDMMIPTETVQVASAYADEFSIAHGGCKNLAERNRANQSPVDRLFCLPGLIPVDSG